MCGRYSYVLRASATEARLNERYPAADVAWDPASRSRYEDRGGSYNVAPSTANPVVTRESPERIALERWGLVPHWADDADRAPINARSETVHETPAFRDAFGERRCLVPAQGFYEWGERDGAERPFRVVPRDDPDDLFLFAGVWDRWTPPEQQRSLGDFGAGGPSGDADEDADDRAIRSYAILTMPANGAVSPIHDRMPVMLHDDELAAWLRGDPAEARAVLDDAGYGSDELDVYPVSRRVNDPGNDGEALWREAGA